MASAVAAPAAGVWTRAAGSADGPAADLFAGHYARLAGWIRRLVDDDDTAHDIASESFTRVLARWRKIDDPVGYLYVVAANLVRDHWRRTRRERRVHDVEQSRVRVEAGAAAPDPDLRTLVTALPERLRTAVLLHYYADFPIAEVARALGRPVGTVKSDLHLARALLRRALEGTS